ncbi:MAG: response regulator transcription factor [Alphaproteobacteria bacterium]|nr:response regulator transcription factor [Alphaproteobacteria bacterium]
MRILLIDQFDICREGMKVILGQMDKDCAFLEAGTIEEAVDLVKDVLPDMVIIDIDVPDISSSDMLAKIEKADFKTNIVIFSVAEEYSIMRRAYEMGIHAFIRKQPKKEITMSILNIVLAGGRYFTPEVIGGTPNRETYGLTNGADRSILSKRQLEVLHLLSEGKPNKIIARELNIATGTVKVHIAGILKALKAKNRTQAVSIANHIHIL